MKHRFIIISILLPAFLAWFSACRHKEDVARSCFEQVTAVNRLVLGQAAITKMAVIDDFDLKTADNSNEKIAGLINSLKIGSRKAAYSYDTYVLAYIDLTDLTPDDVSVDEASKTIEVNLPGVKTRIDGRDIQLREDHYRVTGLRHAITAQERARLKETMNSLVVEEIKRNPAFTGDLLKVSEAKGREFFENLLSRNGEYKVVVNYK